MADRCQANARSGKPCSALAVDGVHCPWHSAAPEWVEKRRQWSAKGGVGKSNRNRARKQLGDVLTPDDLQGLLSLALRSTLAGRLEPGRANAVASLARALVTIRESAELEQRLHALEAAAGLAPRRLA
ncbi:MAG: hypothetical protein ACJ8F2_01255 [Xanthobacteraceae bacterium]